MTDLHTGINNSTSKQLFSFSKSSRFPARKGLNGNIAYETKSVFKADKQLGGGRPFYATSTRFDYYNTEKKQHKSPHPSSHSYPIRDTFGNTAPTKN